MKWLLVLLCTVCGVLSADVGPFAAREGSDFKPYMAAIGRYLPTYTAMINNYIVKNQLANDTSLENEALVPSLQAASPYVGSSPECNACVVGIPVLRWIINKRGKTYEDMRGLLRVICMGVMANEGRNGRLICPGVLDNYGPAVFQIIQDTSDQLWSVQTCRFLNFCPPESIEAKTYGTPDSLPFRPSSTAAMSPLIAAHEDSSLNKEHVRTRRETPEVFKVLQITDVHFDSEYDVGSAVDCKFHVCCRKNYRGTGSASAWGEFSCNMPALTMQRVIRKAAELKPDLVLSTGDIPPHHLWYETLERQMTADSRLAKELQDAFPDTPVLPAIGNHDTFPSNMYYVPNEATKVLHETLLDTHRDLQEDAIKETVRIGGYYEKKIPGQPGLRVVHYNSNYGFTDNWYNVLSHFNQDYLQMRHFVEDRLAAARRDNAKVILIAHHPNGGNIIPFDEWVTKICNEFSDVIVLHTVGHTHQDNFVLYKSRDDTWARSVQFVAPTSGTNTNRNPSLRVYTLDKHTHELLDIEQYRMDLEAAKNMPVDTDPPMELAYRASEEYPLEDMSAVSWHKFALKMNEDTDTLNAFLHHRSTAVAPSKCSEGSEGCIRSTICSLLSTTRPDRMRCNRDGVPKPSVPLE